MSLALQKADAFLEDFALQALWYGTKKTRKTAENGVASKWRVAQRPL
jgi:hypothetical protein